MPLDPTILNLANDLMKKLGDEPRDVVEHELVPVAKINPRDGTPSIQLHCVPRMKILA